MCDNNIRIRNKQRRVDKDFTPAFIDVPCGKCRDCANKKQNDWLIRAFAELNRVKINGGFCLFPTLTYDNEHLPVWKDDRYDFSCPCFDKNHFVAFRNKLRIYLKREGFNFTGDNTIRYFYVTEYGGKKGRPHIHVLLFVPHFIWLPKFKKLVQKAWIYGDVRYSPKGDCLIGSKGIEYAMKYLNKSVAWLRTYGVDEYLYKLRSDVYKSNDLNDKIKYEKILSQFKRCLPHHCQSMGFGISLDKSLMDFYDDVIKPSDIGLFDKTYTFRIPVYYKRKYLYNYDRINHLFTINDFGLDVARLRFPKLVKSLQAYIESKIYSNYYDDLSHVVGDLNIVPFYENYKKLVDFDSELIAKYMLSYRNVSLSAQLYDYFNNVDKIVIEDFVLEGADVMYINRLDVKDLQPMPSGFIPFSKDEKYYNDLPVLRDIEYGLQFMQIADKLISEKNIEAYYETLYKEQIQVKDF